MRGDLRDVALVCRLHHTSRRLSSLFPAPPRHHGHHHGHHHARPPLPVRSQVPPIDHQPWIVCVPASLLDLFFSRPRWPRSPSSHPHPPPPAPLQPAVTRQKRQTRAHLALIHGHSHRNTTRREGPCGPGSGNHTPPKGLFVILTALCGPHGSSLASCPPESTRTGSWPAVDSEHARSPVVVAAVAGRADWPPPLPPSPLRRMLCAMLGPALGNHHRTGSPSYKAGPPPASSPLLSFFLFSKPSTFEPVRIFPLLPLFPFLFPRSCALFNSSKLNIKNKLLQSLYAGRTIPPTNPPPTSPEIF